MMAGNVDAAERASEAKKRRSALENAKTEYDELVERAKKDAGPEGFHAQKAELLKLREELNNMPRAEKEEIDKLLSTAHERQKQKFLDTCFLDTASIPEVGPARKAALRSFGIETAADVTKSRVMQVQGFGESLTRAVLDWKASCEHRFRFNPASAVSGVDRSAVRAKYAAKQAIVERMLAAAPAQLKQFRQKSHARFASLQPRLEAAAHNLAQAQADYSLVE